MTLPVITVADGRRGITVRMERCTSARVLTWPSRGTTIAVTLETSYDGGQTWLLSGAITAEGGIHVRRDGSESPETTFSVQINPGSDRRIRLHIDVENGPLATRATIEDDQ